MRIVSAASAIPGNTTSCDELESRLGLERGWIERRTGILQRPIATPDQATSDLAVSAGKKALQAAAIDPQKIGLLLLATSTPDHLLPPTAPLVAHRLGTRAGAIDVLGACSGFLYALVLGGTWADSAQQAVLVIGANILTRRVNEADPATVALFSDGAGAVVVVPSQPSSLLGSYLSSDGSSYDAITIPSGGSREPLTAESLKAGRNLMTMRRGPALFKHAVHGMADAGMQALKQAGLTAADIRWWIPHQASVRIIQDTGALLGIDSARTVSVVARYGNSSAATIPIAIFEAVSDNRIKEGDTILMTAAGAGLITAGAVLRW
jgi:3-oxoacyl-[acyl-carrier-protein] synthase-3